MGRLIHYCRAITNQHVNLVKWLLKERDISDPAYLGLAALIGKKKTFVILTRQGANPETPICIRYPAPYPVKWVPVEQLVSALTEEDQSETELQETHETPTQLACIAGHLSIVKLLAPTLTLGDEKGSPLLRALAYQHSEVAEFLAPIELKRRLQLISSANKNSASAFDRWLLLVSLQAAAANHLSVLQLLLEGDDECGLVLPHGPKAICQLWDKVTHGFSASLLHHACSHGNREMVSTLLSYGASLENRDENGHLAIKAAVAKGHLEVVELCVKAKPSLLHEDLRKARTDFTPGMCWSMLHEAAREGNLEILKLLRALGAPIMETPIEDFDLRFVKPISPLGAACRGGKVEVARYLLEEVGYPLRQKEFDSLVFGAVVRGDMEFLRLLAERQGEGLSFKNCLHSVATRQDTPLHLAARKDDVAILEFLLPMGIDVNARDYYGETALMIAKQNNKQKNYNLLLQYGARLPDDQEL